MVFIWLMAYALSVLLANIYIDTFISLPYGLLAVGTIFFGAVFTLRDRLHQYGLNAVFLGITLALVISLAHSLYNNTPLQFIVASFISILTSELADTWVFEKMKERSWTLKVLSSNAISVPLDSVLFALLAFWGLPEFQNIDEIIFADIVVKYIVSGIIALNPVILFRSFKKWRSKSSDIIVSN